MLIREASARPRHAMPSHARPPVTLSFERRLCARRHHAEGLSPDNNMRRQQEKRQRAQHAIVRKRHATAPQQRGIRARRYEHSSWRPQAPHAIQAAGAARTREVSAVL